MGQLKITPCCRKWISDSTIQSRCMLTMCPTIRRVLFTSHHLVPVEIQLQNQCLCCSLQDFALDCPIILFLANTHVHWHATAGNLIAAGSNCIFCQEQYFFRVCQYTPTYAFICPEQTDWLVYIHTVQWKVGGMMVLKPHALVCWEVHLLLQSRFPLIWI